MTKALKIAVDYCNENIPDFQERVRMALVKMEYWGCPLIQVDFSLYDDIQDAMADCAEDYEIDVEDISIEDIVWA